MADLQSYKFLFNKFIYSNETIYSIVLISKHEPHNINDSFFPKMLPFISFTILCNIYIFTFNALVVVSVSYFICCCCCCCFSEVLDEHNPWYCPKCRKNQCANKTMTVWRYPDTLIVYLKRYSLCPFRVLTDILSYCYYKLE